MVQCSCGSQLDEVVQEMILLSDDFAHHEERDDGVVNWTFYMISMCPSTFHAAYMH